jgi:uncharacterized membrane protein YjfL (UPF0719 family)
LVDSQKLVLVLIILDFTRPEVKRIKNYGKAVACLSAAVAVAVAVAIAASRVL